MEHQEKRRMPRDPAEKQALIRRLHRIVGQLEGIERMIEEDRYCGDILNQTAAAQKALQSVGCLLLDSHMHSCVTTRIREGDDAVIDELSALMRKLK
ncbi:metal-sensing transcriptional repressor [Faecalibaculum rodentium]|uniref:metal-sensing transcriptional repressor n=1 Tax=Faecalibaculum rodentium TaxID=1702221 RepID=UPI0023F1CE29|nr:metal-sensing transcriptional repressor [Faecalibaculum rodentium]